MPFTVNDKFKLPVAEIDDMLTGREKFPLFTASVKLSAAEEAFRLVVPSLNTRSTFALTDPRLQKTRFVLKYAPSNCCIYNQFEYFQHIHCFRKVTSQLCIFKK